MFLAIVPYGGHLNYYTNSGVNIKRWNVDVSVEFIKILENLYKDQ